jgi:DNA invertase Pin-like site-specific DNA recombinase
MTCAIYARSACSGHNETEDRSLKEQIVQINNWAKENGFNIVIKYLDSGKSGMDCERPKFKEMMADAVLGKFDTLIVCDLSRLSRSTNVLRVIEKLNLIGVRLIAMNNSIDTTVIE